MSTPTTDKKYNGWTNYETWLVKLWIDNDYGSNSYFANLARETYEEAEADKAFTKEENATLNLSKQVRSYHEEIIDETTKPTGFIADLLNAAMSEVNWHEIAESLIEDAKQE